MSLANEIRIIQLVLVNVNCSSIPTNLLSSKLITSTVSPLAPYVSAALSKLCIAVVIISTWIHLRLNELSLLLVWWLYDLHLLLLLAHVLIVLSLLLRTLVTYHEWLLDTDSCIIIENTLSWSKTAQKSES